MMEDSGMIYIYIDIDILKFDVRNCDVMDLFDFADDDGGSKKMKMVVVFVSERCLVLIRTM